jgi:hypothetical protein
MTKLNTLKTFDKLIKSGFNEEQSRAITEIINETTTNISKEFVSNKLMTALGAILFALGGFLGNQLWVMSVKLDELEFRIEKSLSNIEDKINH